MTGVVQLFLVLFKQKIFLIVAFSSHEKREDNRIADSWISFVPMADVVIYARNPMEKHFQGIHILRFARKSLDPVKIRFLSLFNTYIVYLLRENLLLFSRL